MRDRFRRRNGALGLLLIHFPLPFRKSTPGEGMLSVLPDGRIAISHSSSRTRVDDNSFERKERKVRRMEEDSGSPLGPGEFSHSGMFSDHRLPLSGEHFQERFSRFSETAKTNFAQISGCFAWLRPLRWNDVLSPEQEHRFFWIYVPGQWEVCKPAVAAAVQQIPVLSVALQSDPRHNDRLQYLMLATYNAYVLVFAMEGLAQQTPGWSRRSELIPEEVRRWLLSPDVQLISSGAHHDSAFTVDGITFANHVDCDAIFLRYQAKGIVHPTFSIAKIDVSWLLTYAIDYHHRPMEEKRFVHMVGPHSFGPWPSHRQPGWRPDAVQEPKPAEEFYCFFEATAPFAFVWRLLLHGITYGGMNAVDPELPLRGLLITFLSSAGATDEEARMRDPLGLTSDRHVGPPPVPPFAASTGAVTGEATMTVSTVASATVTTSSETPFSPKPTRRRVTLLTAPLFHDYRQHFPPLPPGAAARVATASEREEADDLLLADNALVAELDADAATVPMEVGEPRTKPAATEHPGYFTVEGLRQQQQPETSRPGSARPPTGPSRPASVEFVGRTRKVFCPAGPQGSAGPSQGIASGGNREPLGRTPSGPPPPRPYAGPGDLRYQLMQKQKRPAPASISGEVQGKDSLEKGEQHQAALGYYLHFDVRSQMDPTANAAAFAAEASAAISPAPMVLPPPGNTTEFVRRITRRSQRRGRAIKSEHSSAPPINAKAKNNSVLTFAERAWNPFMQKPLFHRRCNVCSSQHCSRFLLGTNEPNCNKYREHLLLSSTRRICDYRRCSTPQDHFTPVCPDLHQRCPLCGCRGHGRQDGCDATNNGIMQAFREDFEEQADVGYYTQQRSNQIAWGFYPVPPTAPRSANQPFVDYGRLTVREPLDALAFLKSILAAPDNQGEAPPQMEAPSSFERAGCGEVAPFRLSFGATSSPAQRPEEATVSADTGTERGVVDPEDEDGQRELRNADE